MKIFLKGIRRPRGEEVEIEYGPSEAKQEFINGIASGLGANAVGPFTLTKGDGDDLLDFEDPQQPTVIESGVYSVTGTVYGFDDSADGFIEGALNMGINGIGGTTNAPYASGGGSVPVNGTAVLNAGDHIMVNYMNGGTSTNIDLATNITLVKIA